MASIVYVRLTDKQFAALEDLVERQPGKKSDHVRHAVKQYLEAKGYQLEETDELDAVEADDVQAG